MIAMSMLSSLLATAAGSQELMGRRSVRSGGGEVR